LFGRVVCLFSIGGNVFGLGEGGVFSTNVDAENLTLINHKCVCGALNRHFCQTRVSGSLFFSVVLCRLILLVSWCVGLQALLIFLALICAMEKKQMCLQMR
jgi:hypothetical protein